MSADHGAHALAAGRSPGIAVAGWFWVCAGAGKIVGMPAYLVALSRTQGFESFTDTGLTAGAPWFAALTSLLARHVAVLAAGWASLGAFMLVAGLCFLRRRPWARLGLEVLCWFGVVEAPTVAVFLHRVRHLVLRSHLPAADHLAPLLVGGISICVVWLLVYAMSLAVLRSAAIHDWFATQSLSRHEA